MSLIKSILSTIQPIAGFLMIPSDYMWQKYKNLPELRSHQLPHEWLSNHAYKVGELLVQIIPGLLGLFLDELTGNDSKDIESGPFFRGFRDLVNLPSKLVGSIFQIAANILFYIVPTILTTTADIITRAVVGTIATGFSAIGLALESATLVLALVASAAIAITTTVLSPFSWLGKKIFGSKDAQQYNDELIPGENQNTNYYPANSTSKIISQSGMTYDPYVKTIIVENTSEDNTSLNNNNSSSNSVHSEPTNNYDPINDSPRYKG